MADLIPCPISSVFLSVYLCGCGQFSLYFIPVLSWVFDSSLFIPCLCFCVKIINKFSTIYQACCLIWFQMLNWTGNRMKDWPATSFPASNSWWWAVNQVYHSVDKWDQALAVRLSQRSSLQASAPGSQLQVCTSANKNPASGSELSDQALAPGFYSLPDPCWILCSRHFTTWFPVGGPADFSCWFPVHRPVRVLILGLLWQWPPAWLLQLLPWYTQSTDLFCPSAVFWSPSRPASTFCPSARWRFPAAPLYCPQGAWVWSLAPPPVQYCRSVSDRSSLLWWLHRTEYEH